MKVGHKPAEGTTRNRRAPEGPARGNRQRAGTRTRPQEPRGVRQGPQSAPTPRPVERPGRPKTTTQAKARAKARKAKAPKVVRPPLRDRLRERLIARLEGVDLRPQVLLARVPFVVLIIGALGLGLGITLWLSTDAAQRSYQLGSERALNDALTQQKEALENEVLEAQSAPALADAARNLGMIPSKDTAHLVQDPTGNWVVVGKPKPAEGASPPPLNTKLPVELPPAPAAPAPPAALAPKPGASVEVPKRVGALPGVPAGAEVPVVLPPAAGTPHAGGSVMPPGLQLVPLPGPADTLAAAPPVLAAPAAPTVAGVPNVTAVTPVAPTAPVVLPPVAMTPGVPSQ
jgi:hypothetical protein